VTARHRPPRGSLPAIAGAATGLALAAATAALGWAPDNERIRGVEAPTTLSPTADLDTLAVPLPTAATTTLERATTTRACRCETRTPVATAPAATEEPPPPAQTTTRTSTVISQTAEQNETVPPSPSASTERRATTNAATTAPHGDPAPTTATATETNDPDEDEDDTDDD
jgi:hypothetical protein